MSILADDARQQLGAATTALAVSSRRRSPRSRNVRRRRGCTRTTVTAWRRSPQRLGHSDSRHSRDRASWLCRPAGSSSSAIGTTRNGIRHPAWAGSSRSRRSGCVDLTGASSSSSGVVVRRIVSARTSSSASSTSASSATSSSSSTATTSGTTSSSSTSSTSSSSRRPRPGHPLSHRRRRSPRRSLRRVPPRRIPHLFAVTSHKFLFCSAGSVEPFCKVGVAISHKECIITRFLSVLDDFARPCARLPGARGRCRRSRRSAWRRRFLRGRPVRGSAGPSRAPPGGSWDGPGGPSAAR